MDAPRPGFGYDSCMKHPLYTIGYEGAAIEPFVLTLKKAGVKTLIDVRDVPISRKKGFSKNTLRMTLADNGIDYVHLKGLGDPKAGRAAARAGRYNRFRTIFAKHMRTNAAQVDLKVLEGLAEKRPVALMCFEHDHCCCHRSIVASALVSLTGQTVHNLIVDKALFDHASFCQRSTAAA